MAENRLVWIKGAGDLATGVGWRLVSAGFPIVMTELPGPLCVRRKAAFAEAVFEGRHTVEGITAVLVNSAEEAQMAASWGQVPVLVDPDGQVARSLEPAAAVDAILAKRNTGTALTDAPVVIACGPGFTAGVDCQAVVETQRGHWLGRALYQGSAIPDTGLPGEVAGVAGKRVLRSPCAGAFRGLREIGDRVAAGERVGEILPPGDEAPQPVIAGIGGYLRGLIRTGVTVPSGLKVGDVDPTDERERCFTISDKAFAIGGGVLEALLKLSGGAVR